MEMKVATLDHTNSNSSTPYMSAASSPRRGRSQFDFFFYSAPSSPRSSSAYFNNNDHSILDDVLLYDDYSALLKHDHSSGGCSSVPFGWEVKPGVAKPNKAEDDHQQEQGDEDEFEFEFSGQLDKMGKPSLSSADELFDGGKIRPLKLKPPPNLQINNDNSRRISSENPSLKSPKSAMCKFKDAISVSPKHRRKGSDYHDPFEAAIRNTRNSSGSGSEVNDDDSRIQNRGRSTDMSTNLNKRGGSGCGGSRKGISRSLSPLRVSEFVLHHQQQQLHENQNHNQNQNDGSTSSSSRFFLGRGSTSTSSKKWSLKDLFLFRSASEGHYKDTQAFSKRWSLRSSIHSPGSGSISGSVTESGSVSKRRGQASAHEMHYTTNKAVAEEMKKKTSLPYKHGLLACLGFSPVLPQFSYAFPSSSNLS